MKLAVISDLHIPAAEAPGSFGHEDGEFLRFLRFLETSFEHIVLLGDIWETLTGRAPGKSEQQLRVARESHPELAARFSTPRYSYIHGNHDQVAGDTQRAAESLMVEADGVRILFAHGHQQDALVQRAKFVSETGVWLGGWLRRLGLSSLYQLSERMDQLCAGLTGGGSRAVRQWAASVAQVYEADVVVTGHTHRAERMECGGRLLLNSGACNQGRYSFLSLDTGNGSYTLHDSW